MRKRREYQNRAKDYQFWQSRKLQHWASAAASGLILVKFSCIHRCEARDLATKLVDLFKTMVIPVIWILGTPVNGSAFRSLSPMNVLKQLVLQALQINHPILSERSTSLNPARFQCATTEQDWFGLLASVLIGIPHLHVVIDISVLSEELGSQLLWPTAFVSLFDRIASACPSTIVKVVLVTTGASAYTGDSSSEESSSDFAVIRIDGLRGGRLNAKRGFKSRSPRNGAYRNAMNTFKPYILRPNTSPNREPFAVDGNSQPSTTTLGGAVE